MIIQHNIAAVNAHRQLSGNNNIVSKNLEKLSSGFRINKAGDDAAGLAISEKMRAQIKGLERASSNAQDGISLIQTAEGALTEVHSMLNRMVELSVQSANGTYKDDVDRDALQSEVDSLTTEIDRVAQATNFNGINLIDGSLGGGKAGTSNGTTFDGASVARFKAASTAGLAATGTSLAKVASGGSIDTFIVDGEKLTIDWTKGDAKVILTAMKATASKRTTDQGIDFAKKLTALFNDAAKEQGLKGTVSITSASGALTLKSNSKNFDSEFSYAGTNVAKPGSADSLGGMLFGSKTAETGTSKIAVATKEYNGETITKATDTFKMNINGNDFTVKLAGTVTTISKGAGMSTVATALLGAATGSVAGGIKKAVKDYNDANGYVTGDAGFVDDSKFTVEAGKEGGLIIKYTGDENVNFSFSDRTGKDNTVHTAALLGLASGSSSSGGNKGLQLQVGDSNAGFNKVSVSVDDMSAKGLGINVVDVSNKEGAGRAQQIVKDAINKVSTNRGNLGALQNRLEHTISNLGVTTENMTAAESRVRDVDMAKEMMMFTKNNVLTQAAQAMLAQANQQPQGVLQLLR